VTETEAVMSQIARVMEGGGYASRNEIPEETWRLIVEEDVSDETLDAAMDNLEIARKLRAEMEE
jgi:hypothetical protein